VSFCNNYGITLSYSSLYHPQDNGQAESSNKSLMKIIKRIIGNNMKPWDSKIKLVAWDDRVTIKRVIGKSPFELVYGAKVRMLVNNLLLVYKFKQENDDDSNKMQWQKGSTN